MLTSLDSGGLAVMVVLYRYPVPLSILAMPAKRCRELRTIAETGRKKRARSASGFAIDAPFVARPAGGGKRPRGKGSFLAKAQYGRNQRKACPPPGCEPGFARCTPPATTNRPFPPDPLHHCVGAGLVLSGWCEPAPVVVRTPLRFVPYPIRTNQLQTAGNPLGCWCAFNRIAVHV